MWGGRCSRRALGPHSARRTTLRPRGISAYWLCTPDPQSQGAGGSVSSSPGPCACVRRALRTAPAGGAGPCRGRCVNAFTGNLRPLPPGFTRLKSFSGCSSSTPKASCTGKRRSAEVLSERSGPPGPVHAVTVPRWRAMARVLWGQKVPRAGCLPIGRTRVVT